MGQMWPAGGGAPLFAIHRSRKFGSKFHCFALRTVSLPRTRNALRHRRLFARDFRLVRRCPYRLVLRIRVQEVTLHVVDGGPAVELDCGDAQGRGLLKWDGRRFGNGTVRSRVPEDGRR